MHQRGLCSPSMHRWETESKKKEAAGLQRPAVGVRRELCSPGRSSPSAALALPPCLPLLLSEVEREIYFFLPSVSPPSFPLLSLSFLFCCWDRSLLCSFWLALYTFDWHGTHGDPPASVSFMPDDRWASASQCLTPFPSLSQISARNTLCPCYCYYRYCNKTRLRLFQCYRLWLSALPVSYSSQ